MNYDTPTQTLEVAAGEYPALAEAPDGLSGTGKFSFRVVKRGDTAGRLTLELSDIAFETENRADKAYKKLTGNNAAPGEMEDEDEDDGTDVA